MNGSHFLKTLGHTHSDWVFGTIAELVDNSRDAKATKLSVSLEYLKSVGEEIPMLSFVDDGCGMNHEEVLKMISFGPPKRKEYDTGHIEIGRFGISFKIGAMALGRDALVLTQTTKSRSLAFLSQTLNEGKIVNNREDGEMIFTKQCLMQLGNGSHHLSSFFVGDQLGGPLLSSNGVSPATDFYEATSTPGQC
ncbi:unnamed protein product [Cuscuta epithymum]|uniref:Uncharacterized protein n=1 Tax=Cuscuta epithymum TaxID=186058 RepID=A0AAV0DCX2_9ASTE|nr:unnamed protein product [Cuscuta epithymum]